MRRIGGKLPLNAESGLESIKRLVDRLHEGQNFFGNFRGSGRMIQRAMTTTGSLPLFKNLLRTLLKRVSVSRRQVASFPAGTRYQPGHLTEFCRKCSLCFRSIAVS